MIDKILLNGIIATTLFWIIITVLLYKKYKNKNALILSLSSIVASFILNVWTLMYYAYVLYFLVRFQIATKNATLLIIILTLLTSILSIFIQRKYFKDNKIWAAILYPIFIIITLPVTSVALFQIWQLTL